LTFPLAHAPTPGLDCGRGSEQIRHAITERPQQGTRSYKATSRFFLHTLNISKRLAPTAGQMSFTQIIVFLTKIHQKQKTKHAFSIKEGAFLSMHKKFSSA
jgi:hypothetical protein